MIYYHSLELSPLSQFAESDINDDGLTNTCSVTSDESGFNVPTANDWPWGNTMYQPKPTVEYKEPADLASDYQLDDLLVVMREQLTEVIAEEAINAGRKAIKRQKREAKEAQKRAQMGVEAVKEDESPFTMAFDNEIVRGRTIYNP